jgi:hypothetical protein
MTSKSQSCTRVCRKDLGVAAEHLSCMLSGCAACDSASTAATEEAARFCLAAVWQLSCARCGFGAIESSHSQNCTALAQNALRVFGGTGPPVAKA